MRCLWILGAELCSLLSRQMGCQVDRRAAFVSGRIMVLMLATSVCWAQIPTRAPLGLIWEAELSPGGLCYTQVESLLGAYEQQVGKGLKPGERGKVGLKVNTRSGRGLSTPKELVRAVILAMERRGFDREAIWIIDYSEYSMRQAGYIPLLREAAALFEGCPVIALDLENHYDLNWFYDSPLPPILRQESQSFGEIDEGASLKEGAEARKSYLPAPLLFEVDFWINLAVGVDDPALGVDGALSNATIWNVSNSQRFLVNQATASAAVAEIGAIPELHERMVLHFMSMERYQFIAGPFFNSLYTRSEPLLRMSSDPVALDRVLLRRINDLRRIEGFPEIDPLPQQFPFAASLQLGVFHTHAIQIRKVKTNCNVPDQGAEILTNTE